MATRQKKQQRRARRKASRSLKANAIPQNFRILEANADSEFAIEAAAAGDDKKLRSFSMLAYNGGPMRLSGFAHPVVVDLSGVEVAAKSRPILRDHDPARIVGHTTAIEVAGNIRLKGVISGANGHAQEVQAAADNGFPWQASIGAEAVEVAFIERGQASEVNGQTVKGPAYIARKSRLREVSFVALGADDDTDSRLEGGSQQPSAEVLTMEFTKWLEAKGFSNPDELSDTQKASLKAAYDAEMKASQTPPPGSDPPPASPHGADFLATLEAERKEKERVDGINLVASQAIRDYPAQLETVENLVKAAHDDKTVDPQKFELSLLRAMRPSGPARVGGDREIGDRVITAAICKTLNLRSLEKQFDERTLDATDRHFKHGVGLQQLLFRAAAANGQHYDSAANLRGLLQAAFLPADIRAGFSTMSLPGILSDSMNKILLDHFTHVESTWKQIAAIRPVRDFRTVSSYSLSGDLQYEQVGPTGELKHGTLGETEYTNRAKTYGKVLGISREDIINDDLSALQRVPQRLGRGAALKINDVFWTAFLDNSSFFTAGNNNVSTGAGSALDDTGAGINAAEVVFAAQTDPDGKPLGVMPRILLAPPTLANTAARLMGSMLTTGGDSNVADKNVYEGKYRVASSVYMENSTYTGNSAAAWYLLADPMDMPVIEVVFLNGREVPIIESADADFNTLGIMVRGFHDFGVSLQEERGGVRSAGS